MTTTTKKAGTKFYGLGRRKRAIARVYLDSESKEKTVNGLAVDKYFTSVGAHQAALEPLELTSTMDTHGIKVKVLGGGKRAQADAIRLGVARALVKLNPDWRKQLKGAGMLSRDPRVKERKKYGLKRARRAPQFSKR